MALIIRQLMQALNDQKGCMGEAERHRIQGIFCDGQVSPIC